jgi:hypothetical protein
LILPSEFLINNVINSFVIVSLSLILLSLNINIDGIPFINKFVFIKLFSYNSVDLMVLYSLNKFDIEYFLVNNSIF